MESSRGVKHKQVQISQKTPGSTISTPSKDSMPSKDLILFNMDAPEPLVLPESRVCPSDHQLLSAITKMFIFQGQNYYFEKLAVRWKSYLSRLLQNEAPPVNLQCISCKMRQCQWRCLDCVGRPVLCSECIRNRHWSNPFHQVDNWTGTHFEPTWLFQAGVEMHLGHHGLPCPAHRGSNLPPFPNNAQANASVDASRDANPNPQGQNMEPLQSKYPIDMEIIH